METPVLRYKLADNAGFGTRIYAIVIILGGGWLFTTSPIGGMLLVILGILPFLYYKCLEIDLYRGTYCVGVNIAGNIYGDREPYPGTKCIFIKKNRTIASNSRRSWRPIVSTSFDSFLWLEDDTKILLSYDSNFEAAMLRLQPFAQELQTEIRDLTAPLSQV